jgi:IS1 family transposase
VARLRESAGLRLDVLVLPGCSLNATFRITGVSVSTQLRQIKKIGREIVPFPEYKQGDIYELDEMRTYVGRKTRPIWVILAKSRITGRIVDMQIGRRTKKSLKRVTDKLLLLNPKAIFTDGLKEYRYLIPENIHKVKRYGTNHIERFNLTLRTHISRLNRRTICYSKSKLMLEYTIKIYLWG